MEDQPTRIQHLGDEAAWRDVLGSAPAEPTAEAIAEEPPRRDSRGRALATGAGLVLGGVLLGTVVVTAGQAALGDSSPTAGTAAVQLPAGQGFGGGAKQQGAVPPQQGGMPRGGLDGEQRLSGTVTAVGAGSVTVKTSSGTATYAVSSTTDIVKDGRRVTLSALATGDAVLVHVYPSGSGMAVERILAGSSVNGFGGGPGFGPPGGDSDGDGGAAPTGTTSGRST